MSFDWDEFSRLSDEEKVAYMRRVRDADLKEAEGKTFPPGALGLEKARWQHPPEVVGRMNPDGTVHYYTEEEKQALLDAHNSADSEPDTDGEDEPA